MIKMKNQSWRLFPGLQGKLQRWWKYGEMENQSWSVISRSPGCFWSLPLQTLWRVAGKSSATAWRRWGFEILISNKSILYLECVFKTSKFWRSKFPEIHQIKYPLSRFKHLKSQSQRYYAKVPIQTPDCKSSLLWIKLDHICESMTIFQPFRSKWNFS